jgi:Nif-specific regulatory protein
MQQKVKREIKELSLLFEISQILARNMDISETLEPVLKAMADHMEMLRGTIALLNRETGDISIEAAHGLSVSQMERGRYKLGEGITGRVIQTGQSAVVQSISREPLFLNRTGARKNLRKKDISFICVPIKLGSEVIGALSADRLFSDRIALQEDLRLLFIIASMLAQAVRLRQSAQEDRQRLLNENLRLQEQLKERFKPSNIIGESKAMENVYGLIVQVSKTDTTVLLRGESGVGKELVAHAIHYNSPRSSNPFIRVNCAALPETLIESELFGHEKGAFTGAVFTRKGRFELANSGTIFLDEIGDLSPAIQVKLLRALQEKEFERIGGAATIKVNVRVIAATNRNLEELIVQGSFRQDIYYRLNVFPIFIPSLRERRTDIPLLVDFFVKKYSSAHKKPIHSISTSAMDLLINYHWPGNVRELENCIERAVLMSNDGVIHGHNLPLILQPISFTGTNTTGSLQAALDNLERELIIDAIKSSHGNLAKAARILGITERIIGLRVAKHGVDLKQFRTKLK